MTLDEIKEFSLQSRTNTIEARKRLVDTNGLNNKVTKKLFEVILEGGEEIQKKGITLSVEQVMELLNANNEIVQDLEVVIGLLDAYGAVLDNFASRMQTAGLPPDSHIF